jgi:hypothetical protein
MKISTKFNKFFIVSLILSLTGVAFLVYSFLVANLPLNRGRYPSITYLLTVAIFCEREITTIDHPLSLSLLFSSTFLQKPRVFFGCILLLWMTLVYFCVFCFVDFVFSLFIVVSMYFFKTVGALCEYFDPSLYWYFHFLRTVEILIRSLNRYWHRR